MKILQVMAGGEFGGAETAFVDMAIAMHETGQDVEVVTRANALRVSQLQGAGLKVHILPLSGPLDVYSSWRMGKIIKEFQPLIVQTWMARAAKKTPNWKRVRTPQRYLTVGRLGGYYKTRNFKSMDYLIAITPDIKRHLVKGGVPEHTIRCINNFAETEDNPVPVHKSDFDTPENAIVLLSLARFHANKALDIAIEAMADLPGVYLWLAGEGPLHGELEKLAQAKGVSDRVRFLGWRTDRGALLHAADICIFCSRVEPFGTVFAQAWACRTPVIVSDADGPRQFCRHEEDSLIVPRDNAKALAEAVQRLAADKTLQAKLVAEGYRRYQNEFTKPKVVAAYLDYYLEILKKERLLD